MGGKRRRRGRPEALLAGALLAAAVAAAAPAGGAAQGVTRPPEVVAQEFLDGFRGLAWRATAQRVDADALADFRAVVTMMTEIPRGRVFSEMLLGGADSAAYAAMDDPAVFAQVVGALFQRMPGLLHAMAVKQVEVVGAVRDASGDTAWAVYRSLAGLSGAETEMRVMTLVRRGGRWGVRSAPEIDVLLTAMRGIPLRPPPDSVGGAAPPGPSHPRPGRDASRGGGGAVGPRGEGPPSRSPASAGGGGGWVAARSRGGMGHAPFRVVVAGAVGRALGPGTPGIAGGHGLVQEPLEIGVREARQVVTVGGGRLHHALPGVEA